MIHPKIFIDNKGAEKHAALTTLDTIRQRAKAEGKLGVLTLTRNRKHGWGYVIHSDDMVPFLRLLAEDLDFVQQAVCDESVLSADTFYIGPSLHSASKKKAVVETIGDAVSAEKTKVRVCTRSAKKKELRRNARTLLVINKAKR